MKVGILNTVNKADIDIETDIRNNGVTMPLFEIAQTLSATYSELTDPVDFDNFKGLLRRDFKFIRLKVKDTIYALAGADLSGWDTALTIIQRKVASKYFVVPQSLRNTVHALNEQKENGYFFHKYSKLSREARIEEVVKILLNELQPADADEVIYDVTAVPNLLYLYTFFGREGTMEGDIRQYLFDYIEARTGTVFETRGLRVKAFTTTSGVTMVELATNVMDILKNGNYEYFGEL